MIEKWRSYIIFVFLLLALGSAWGAFQLKFSFDFEQFFPEGDADLNYFLEFRERFEPDDNFLLLALENKEGIFEQDFLEDAHALTLQLKRIELIKQSISPTTISYPIKVPLIGFTSRPAIHRKSPEKYAQDSIRLLSDERFVGSLVSKDAKSLVIYMKTVDQLLQSEAEHLMDTIGTVLNAYTFDDSHYLGSAYFMDELVAMQKREMIVSTLVSGALVFFVMFLIFRRFWGIVISLFSIAFGMLLFLGLLALLGRELNAMAALYPVLMIIVGTSDVIHVMSKYIDELKAGKDKSEAIRITIREIGMATFLTSVTTSIGFITLWTSRIPPIRDFGLNCAMGVMVAYITVLLFTCSLITFFKVDQIIKIRKGDQRWYNWLSRFNQFTIRSPKQIALGTLVLLFFTFLGISMISTNYNIKEIFPRGKKITSDFTFFEEQFSGFRPFEIAVHVKDADKDIFDFEVIKQINDLENHLKKYEEIGNAMSVTSLFKSLNRASNGDRLEAYKLPTSEKRFEEYKRLVKKFPQQMNVLVSEDEKYGRISSRFLDVGADTIKAISQRIDLWVNETLDTNMLTFTQTGTGVIVDKNSVYIRNSLIQGLGLAILIVSLLMAFLFKSWKMVIIALLPNLIPLLISGAFLGFGGIELEAGIAIVFAIVFGIAVDDTIHFLSKYKLSLQKGLSIEEAIQLTFVETGKAICLTSIVLFFGFLVLLFSIHPPSVTIGALISLTLFTAVFADLLIIPVMIRWFYKEDL